MLEKLIVAQVHWHQIAVGAEVGADAMMPNSIKMSCGTGPRHGCRAAEAVICGSIAGLAAPSSLRAIKFP
ncbi:conserved hypothetical protein [Mesorhizobium delmotii]|uniref:Uncharacterized protein n=1 Tax=Mesorhizobium delmotii TaxID=1631247 RepID=A0A2P9AEC3_9HYPH|nr:conserved hypothetical protein [Mesorhizobium delmotii]